MPRQIILADDPEIACSLLPLTFTRPVSELLLGLTTLRSKWERLLPGDYSYITADYLRELYPNAEPASDTLVIASHIVASRRLADTVALLLPGEALTKGERTIAYCGRPERFIPYPGEVTSIEYAYDLFIHNAEEIRNDFELLTETEVSRPLSKTCTVIGTSARIFLDEGARAEGVTFNTEHGPI